jgi:hypothetical protein
MTDSYILIYEEDDGRVIYFGAWRAHGKNLVGESLGLSIIRGLGGFTTEATPQDLVNQLESNGIHRAEFPSGTLPSEEQAFLAREAEDLTRVTFKANGQIGVRWFTSDSDIRRALGDPPALGLGVLAGHN